MRGHLADEARGAVESHVDGCPSCRQAIAALACSSTDSSVNTSTSDVTSSKLSDLAPGTEVEHFRVERLLGRGGMGEVYLARDIQLDRLVALKVIRPEQALSAEGVRRLLDEARTTARFNHPNVVTIYHVGTTPDGLPYLALEYLDGETLRQRMQRGPMHLSEILHVLHAITNALAEAQAHGVLHRDLKPENVMQLRDGRVRVLDFGLAVLEPATPSNSAAKMDPKADPIVDSDTELLSHSRALRGTPAYMAPEQWRGDAAVEATDVWALGVILFEAITGRRPFTESNIGALCARVTDDQPGPSLQAFAAMIPPALRHLCEGCLAKHPAARPTVGQVITTLQVVGEQMVGEQTVGVPSAPNPATPPSAAALSALASAAELHPTGPQRSRAAGSWLTCCGALITLLGFASLAGGVGKWREGYVGDLTFEVLSLLLMAGLPLVLGSLMLFFGLRRPTSGVALMIVGLLIAIIGGTVSIAAFATVGRSATPGSNLVIAIIIGVLPLMEGILLIVRGVRDFKAAARATLLATATQLAAANQTQPLVSPVGTTILAPDEPVSPHAQTQTPRQRA